MARVAIIDSGIANLASVANAFRHLEIAAEVTAAPAALAGFSHLVLPGVGSFAAGIARLRAAGLDEAVVRAAEFGKPILGLCLGMQLLAGCGDEFGPNDGLGLIPGRVRRLTAAPGLRLPHIGWNDVAFKDGSVLGAGLGGSAVFYFVHGYGYDDAGSPSVTGTCDYGGPVVATVERDNVMGAQFHPEKSQKAGLSLIRTFAALC